MPTAAALNHFMKIGPQLGEQFWQTDRQTYRQTNRVKTFPAFLGGGEVNKGEFFDQT